MSTTAYIESWSKTISGPIASNPTTSSSNNGDEVEPSTISGLSSFRTDRSRPRLGRDFFNNGSGSSQKHDEELSGFLSSGKPINDAWTISVLASRQGLGNGLKRRNTTTRDRDSFRLTIYVSTPTSSLTLIRTAAQIDELEASLRSNHPGRISARTARPAPSPMLSPKKRGTNMFATLHRTLTPRRGSSTDVSDLGADEAALQAGVDVREITNFLTDLSNDLVLRKDEAFTSFFSASGQDDLESARLEKRVKRVKSDLTTHLHPTRDRSAFLTEDRERASPVHSLRHNRLQFSEDDSLGSLSPQETEHVRLFPLPLIPSSKLDFDPNHDDSKRHASTEYERISPKIAVSDLQNTDEVTDVIPSTPPETEMAKSIEMDNPAKSSAGEDEGKPTESASNETPTTDNVSRSKSVKRKIASKKLTIESFEILRVLGKGCAGKVLLVRQRDTQALFALKAIHKQHVLAHRELSHTKTEQAVLKACSQDSSVNPFVVKLHYSFHDQDTLYLALDFHPGGDLATQLARWGRLGRDRSRYYISEIVEGVQGLHRAGIIYRDLKPENILISAEGHVVLTDFGLSKDFGHSNVPGARGDGLPAPKPHWLGTNGADRSNSTPAAFWGASQRETTTTFCGTAEYLAPEVLLGEPYSYEVDAWSLGTMLWEMLAGTTPFYSEDHATMYRRVLHEDLVFDDEARIFDEDTKSLLRGLLQRDPLLRMTDERIKRHPYFSMIVWDHVYHRRYVPPFVPKLNAEGLDLSQFDDMFLSMPNEIGSAESIKKSSVEEGDSPDGEPEAAFDEDGNDVFDGYSYDGHASEDHTSTDETESDLQPAENEAERPDDINHASMPSEGDSNVGTPQAHDAAETERARQTHDLSVSELSEKLNQASLDVRVISTRGDSTSLLEDKIDENADDDEDNEWDVVDREPEAPTARNGGKETTTLWGRGIKDKYRMVLNPPRGSASPLRIPSNVSRTTSRKGSSTSSTIHSPSTASRQATAVDLATLAALSRGAAAGSSPTTNLRKPRKAGATLKRLGLFRPGRA